MRSSRSKPQAPLPLLGPTEAQSRSSSLGSQLRDGPLPLEGVVLPWHRLTQAVLLVDIGLEERLGLGSPLGSPLGAKVTRVLGEVQRRVTRQVTRQVTLQVTRLSAHLDRKEAELKEQQETEQWLRLETQELRERVDQLNAQLSDVLETTEKLKKELEQKEQELNHRQQEMEDIDGFLTDLAEKEANAKAKLQVFMEWLLERADRAERHLLMLTSHKDYLPSPVHRYRLSPEVPVRGGVRSGVRGGVSLDDIITDHYREDVGNRRSFSLSSPLQNQLYHLHSAPLRTLSLDCQDCELSSDLSQTPQKRYKTQQRFEEGWGQTWSRPFHHSTEEEEEEDQSRTQTKTTHATADLDKSHSGRREH